MNIVLNSVDKTKNGSLWRYYWKRDICQKQS